LLGIAVLRVKGSSFFIAGGWYQPVSTDTGPTCITHLVPRGWLVKPVIHHCRVAGSFIIRQASPAD